MRFAIACLLMPMFGGCAFADALLSISATAGTQSCQESATTSAFCSISSSVYVPAGQFYSPASAGGSISFGVTSSAAALALGPQTVGTLDYSLQGNWSIGQGIGLSGQAGASLTASINLPSDSGNWIFYGTSYDATDDQGGGVGPIQIIAGDGNGWIWGSAASPFTVAHTPGTQFAVTVDISDWVQEADSSNNFDFALRMVDPVDTPEPATWLLILPGLASGFLFRTAQRVP